MPTPNYETGLGTLSLDDRIAEHLEKTFQDTWEIRKLSHDFRRNGYVKLRDVVSGEVKNLVSDEVNRLLDLHARRIDITFVRTTKARRQIGADLEAAVERCRNDFVERSERLGDRLVDVLLVVRLRR